MACVCCERHQKNINLINILTYDDLENKYNDKINNSDKYKCKCNCRHKNRATKRNYMFINSCFDNPDQDFNTIAYSMVHPLSCTCCDRHCHDRDLLYSCNKKPSLLQQYSKMCMCDCRHIIRGYKRLK